MLDVEILHFESCPSWGMLVQVVHDLVLAAGGGPEAIRVRSVETREAAVQLRFLGSPTVRVNGTDVDPTAAQRDDFGLQCRIYRSDQGQIDAPPEAWIRAALAAARG